MPREYLSHAICYVFFCSGSGDFTSATTRTEDRAQAAGSEKPLEAVELVSIIGFYAMGVPLVFFQQFYYCVPVYYCKLLHMLKYTRLILPCVLIF